MEIIIVNDIIGSDGNLVITSKISFSVVAELGSVQISVLVIHKHRAIR